MDPAIEDAALHRRVLQPQDAAPGVLTSRVTRGVLELQVIVPDGALLTSARTVIAVGHHAYGAGPR
jgi:hypothetical protein